MIETIFIILSFIFGCIIGSFLNVVIYRIPRGKSILKPAFSFCPSCGTKIRWYDNIPIVSFFLLGGKCRKCKSKINLRYTLIEFLTGTASLITYLKTGFSIEYFFLFTFLSLMIAITFIDYDFKIIPDELNLIGFLSGILYSFFRIDFTIVDSIIGALTGAGTLWMIGYIYLKMRKIEGLGFGDVKMMAFVGAYLGWFGSLFTIFFSSFIGAIAGIIGAYYLKASDKGKFEIPFGPFLAISATIYIFFGDIIKEWYFRGLM